MNKKTFFITTTTIRVLIAISITHTAWSMQKEETHIVDQIQKKKQIIVDQIGTSNYLDKCANSHDISSCERLAKQLHEKHQWLYAKAKKSCLTNSTECTRLVEQLQKVDHQFDQASDLTRLVVQYNTMKVNKQNA